MGLTELLSSHFGSKTFPLVLILSMSVGALGQNNEPSLVPFPIESAFIPQDYDNYDSVKIVVTGTFPTTCYKVGPDVKNIDANTKVLKISQMAYQYHNPRCVRFPVKFSKVIQVGFIATDRDVVYTVKDSNDDSSFLGKLPVRAISNLHANDIIYAPVSDAYVDPQRKEAVLKGWLPDSCSNLADIRISRSSKDVLLIQPILKHSSDTNCIAGNFPYERTVPIPTLESGTYLLHVRSINRESLERIFKWRQLPN